MSSGPLDWPGLALRRSAQIQRKSSLYLSIALKGEAVCQDERAELSPPPGMSSRGKPGTDLFVVDVDRASFVERHGDSPPSASRRYSNSRRRLVVSRVWWRAKEPGCYAWRSSSASS